MLKKLYDVAFNNNVTKLVKKSFHKEIDVTFGLYEDMLSINLQPSNNKVDWKINFNFFPKKIKPIYAKIDSKVKVHSGYIKQWYRHRGEFFEIIRGNEEMLVALKNGLIISGRSKGGAEAPIIAIDIVKNFDVGSVYVGMLEAPKVGNKAFCESVEKYIPKENMYHVKYGADLITMIPPGFKNPGKFIWFDRKFGVSVIDHAIGCFDQERMYEYVEKNKL